MTGSTKGRIVRWAYLHRRDGVMPRQVFEGQRIDHVEHRLVRRALRTNDNVVDWLLVRQAWPWKGAALCCGDMRTGAARKRGGERRADAAQAAG